MRVMPQTPLFIRRSRQISISEGICDRSTGSLTLICDDLDPLHPLHPLTKPPVSTKLSGPLSLMPASSRPPFFETGEILNQVSASPPVPCRLCVDATDVTSSLAPRSRYGCRCWLTNALMVLMRPLIAGAGCSTLLSFCPACASLPFLVLTWEQAGHVCHI